METRHLFDAQADEEKALCGANVPADDLTGVDYYRKRRKDGLPVGTVCEPCKAPAVRWAVIRCPKPEADAGEFRAGADRLERMATNGQAKAEYRCRRAEEAERCRSSAEWRDLEADRLEDEAEECRRVADVLARETGLEK